MRCVLTGSYQGGAFSAPLRQNLKKRMDKKSKEGKRGKNGKKREKLAKMLHIAKMGSKKI